MQLYQSFHKNISSEKSHCSYQLCKAFWITFKSIIVIHLYLGIILAFIIRFQFIFFWKMTNFCDNFFIIKRRIEHFLRHKTNFWLNLFHNFQNSNYFNICLLINNLKLNNQAVYTNVLDVCQRKLCAAHWFLKG